MRTRSSPLLGALALLLVAHSSPAQRPLRISVTFPTTRSATALDGRLLLMLAKTGDTEPRLQINDGPTGQQVFGLDVESWQPDQPAVFDATALGYPLASLAQVPAGDYFVQALLHRYETCRRADGHTVKVPLDRGEGQQWNRAPGNLLSTPRRLRFDPAATEPIHVVLDQQIPPLEPPSDTRYVKHIKIQSRLLSEFWGRPIELGAIVLLPEGFDEHPDARYPLVLHHDHFSATFGEFREQPPDPNLEPDWNERFRIRGYNRIQQEHQHAFFKTWTGTGFPRFLIVKVQHANPYYDDSYAVNSANLGPYGDAIMRELLPEVERRFRGLGQGWARFTYGGSTGGWEALAAQVFYPDEFNGCFAACPDPIDFRAYTTVNLYEDRNAFYLEDDWKRVPRAAKRDWLGRPVLTMEQANQFELVLGTRSRSGQQFDIWEAVFSPIGPDGYPRRIFDKRTGVIDPEVAAHWREHYDLRWILARDWPVLGPKVRGKIHLYCGTLDNYFLDHAVYLTESFLRGTTDPPFDGVVEYGERAEHCWNGDHQQPIWIARLRYHVMYVEKMLARIKQTAPPGADLTSWSY